MPTLPFLLPWQASHLALLINFWLLHPLGHSNRKSCTNKGLLGFDYMFSSFLSFCVFVCVCLLFISAEFHFKRDMGSQFMFRKYKTFPVSAITSFMSAPNFEPIKTSLWLHKTDAHQEGTEIVEIQDNILFIELLHYPYYFM